MIWSLHDCRQGYAYSEVIGKKWVETKNSFQTFRGMFGGIRRLRFIDGFFPKVCQIANNEQDETPQKTQIRCQGLTVAMIRIVVVFVMPPSNLRYTGLFQDISVTFQTRLGSVHRSGLSVVAAGV